MYATLSDEFRTWMRRVHAILGLQLTLDLFVLGVATTVVASLSAESLPTEVSYFGQFIRDVGFPVFVAAYVLIRLERSMLRLTEAIDNLLQAYRQEKRRAD